MPTAQQPTPAERYLDLLKKCLTRYQFGEDYVPVVPLRRTPAGSCSSRCGACWPAGPAARPPRPLRPGLLDEQVRFLPGWFSDTLPTAPIERLAVLRLDGDMYGSTMEALEALYPKLSVGGYVIVDDYGAVPQCKEAVTDFRAAHQIIDPMETVDWTGVYWQRGRP
jgi:hypothetical protein